MTDDNEKLAAQFQAEQEAAQTEAETRDNTAWAQAVAMKEAQMALTTALAARTQALANLLGGLNVILWLVMLSAVAYGATVAVVGLVRWLA